MSEELQQNETISLAQDKILQQIAIQAKRDPYYTLVQGCIGGKIEWVKLAIEAGADVNQFNKDRKIEGKTLKGGWTPLHHAALRDHKEIIKLLLSNGANVNAKTSEGLTPLDYTRQSKFIESETADLLRKHGAKTAEELKAEGK